MTTQKLYGNEIKAQKAVSRAKKISSLCKGLVNNAVFRGNNSASCPDFCFMAL